MLATYMRHMRSNNLETRIAGSSCRPQKQFLWIYDTLGIVPTLLYYCLYNSEKKIKTVSPHHLIKNI